MTNLHYRALLEEVNLDFKKKHTKLVAQNEAMALARGGKEGEKEGDCRLLHLRSFEDCRNTNLHSVFLRDKVASKLVMSQNISLNLISFVS